MIDVQTVVAYIAAQTGYTTKVATDSIPDLQDKSPLVEIHVGYTTIVSANPSSALEHNIINTNGEDLVQGFEVHIICAPSDFRSTWIVVYKLLIGWNPVAAEQVHSGFTYNRGGRMGNNIRMWHIDNWNIGFPTNLVLI